MAIHREEGASFNHAEQARLQALLDLRVLDSPPEAEFDDLVWLATRLCGAPIALVSLVDADRQWFKARCGLAVEQTPRAVSFCTHAIEQDSLFEIPDALQDPRFADNPLVTGEPGVVSQFDLHFTARFFPQCVTGQRVAAVSQCGKAREVHAKVADLQVGHLGVATRMTLGDVCRSRAVLRRRAGSPEMTAAAAARGAGRLG